MHQPRNKKGTGSVKDPRAQHGDSYIREDAFRLYYEKVSNLSRFYDLSI